MGLHSILDRGSRNRVGFGRAASATALATWLRLHGESILDTEPADSETPRPAGTRSKTHSVRASGRCFTSHDRRHCNN